MRQVGLTAAVMAALPPGEWRTCAQVVAAVPGRYREAVNRILSQKFKVGVLERRGVFRQYEYRPSTSPRVDKRRRAAGPVCRIDSDVEPQQVQQLAQYGGEPGAALSPSIGTVASAPPAQPPGGTTWARLVPLAFQMRLAELSRSLEDLAHDARAAALPDAFALPVGRADRELRRLADFLEEQ